jgi:hypothetical protein
MSESSLRSTRNTYEGNGSSLYTVELDYYLKILGYLFATVSRSCGTKVSLKE